MTEHRPDPRSSSDGRRPRRRFLRWIEGALWVMAAVLLGSYFGALAEAELVQARHARQLDAARGVQQDAQATIAAPVTPASASGEDRIGPVLDGADAVNAVTVDKAPSALAAGLVGRLRIEDADVESIVLSGEDDLTLRRAVGHLADTPLPGQGGNVALAGHRDSFFRGLRHVEPGQRIELETLAETFTYEVVDTRIVEPTDLSVLEDTGDEVLTLITCYPFDFVGPAPQRFVVQARQVARRPVGVKATAMTR